MRRSTLAALASVPLAAAAISLGAAAGDTGAVQTQTTGRTITLQQGEFGAFTTADTAPLSPVADSQSPRFRTSPGDRLYLSAPLFTTKGGPRLGRIELEITALRGQGDATSTLTHGVIHLKDGDLILDGFEPSPVKGFAVTGGTGAYGGASGTATQDDHAVDTITLVP